MKNTLLVSLFAACVLLFISCKKDAATPTADVAAKGSSLSILNNYEYNGTWQQKGYMLLDLDHADNRDKKFMVIDVQAVTGGYKFVIKRGPLPIDSLATNWPPEVRSVSFGYSNDIIVNAHMRLLVQSAPSGRFTYTYDSIHKFPGAILTYNYLNNAAFYAGSMAGKPPQGRAFYWDSDASGTSRPRDIIFYFREGFFTNVTSIGNGAQLLITFVNNIPTASDEWKKVDAVLTLPGTYYTHFYFDFDEWRFFTTKDFCPSTWGAPCSAGVQYADYQSMNNLMNWPQGWGK